MKTRIVVVLVVYDRRSHRDQVSTASIDLHSDPRLSSNYLRVATKSEL